MKETGIQRDESVLCGAQGKKTVSTLAFPDVVFKVEGLLHRFAR